MQDQIDTLADRLYQEIYATHDNKAYQTAKTREIADWLAIQKLSGSETLDELSHKWFWDPTLQGLCIPADFA